MTNRAEDDEDVDAYEVLALPVDAALEAALQLGLAFGPVLAFFVAISVGCAAGGRARTLRARLRGREQRHGKKQRCRSNRYVPPAGHRVGSWPADMAARC